MLLREEEAVDIAWRGNAASHIIRDLFLASCSWDSQSQIVSPLLLQIRASLPKHHSSMASWNGSDPPDRGEGGQRRPSQLSASGEKLCFWWLFESEWNCIFCPCSSFERGGLKHTCLLVIKSNPNGKLNSQAELCLSSFGT